jgi:2-dehydro-3-deoxyphosphogluconate aldolase / (4S)-4-hydroxy-2-oxoglutarate aldolase
MTRFSRMTVLSTILQVGAVPTFTPQDADSAWRVVAACRAAGAPVIEVTYRAENGYDVFRELSARIAVEAPDVVLGAGTIYDAPTAAQFITAGASFIVGPTLLPEIARLCNRRKIAYIPGCGSAGEISQAEELGAEIVKLFPAGAFDGPAFIRALLNPSPWSRVMPTAVPPTEERMSAYFNAGASAVGVGPGLITDELQTEPDTSILEGRVRQLLMWIGEARRRRGAPAGVAASDAVRLATST